MKEVYRGQRTASRSFNIVLSSSNANFPTCSVPLFDTPDRVTTVNSSIGNNNRVVDEIKAPCHSAIVLVTGGYTQSCRRSHY